MSNDSGLSFNPEKNFLGDLCQRGHEWGNTGQSVRLKGQSGKCFECKKLECREWRAKNKEKARELCRQWRAENKEKTRESSRLGYERRKDDPVFKQKARDRTSNWLRKNLDRARAYKKGRGAYVARERRKQTFPAKKGHFNAVRRAKYAIDENYRLRTYGYNRNRRARMEENHIFKYGTDQLNQHLANFGGSCVYCGKSCKPTLDHFIPVSRGGSECLSNFVPACRSCNSSKNASDPKEWFQKQPFYDAKRWKAILKALGKTEKTYSQIPLF